MALTSGDSGLAGSAGPGRPAPGTHSRGGFPGPTRPRDSRARGLGPTGTPPLPRSGRASRPGSGGRPALGGELGGPQGPSRPALPP